MTVKSSSKRRSLGRLYPYLTQRQARLGLGFVAIVFSNAFQMMGPWVMGLSTIQKCDKIIVMHKDRVKEVATHQELLAPRGLYHKLYQLQYKDQEIPVPETN